MTEPKIEIYVNKGKAICWSRHGVLWSINLDERLGSFSDSEVFDNDDRIVASNLTNTELSTRMVTYWDMLRKLLKAKARAFLQHTIFLYTVS